MWHFWLIAAGVFFIVEIATTGFLVFWLGIGALIAMLVSFVIPNLYVQAAVFVVSSILLLFLTRPFVEKFVSKKKAVPTNAYSIIGHNALVIKEIDPVMGTGQIKINGDTWSAKSATDEKIPVNTEVEILKIDGVKAVVTTLVSHKEDTKKDTSKT